MGAEQWQDAKTDYGVEGIPTTFFNKIEGNAAVNHKGGGQASLSIIAADASFVLDIGDDEQTFMIDLDASYDLKFISTTNRQPRNEINIITTGTGSVSLHNNASSPPANSEAILVSGAGLSGSSYTLQPYSLYTFVFSGAYWYCNPFAVLT